MTQSFVVTILKVCGGMQQAASGVPLPASSFQLQLPAKSFRIWSVDCALNVSSWKLAAGSWQLALLNVNPATDGGAVGDGEAWRADVP